MKDTKHWELRLDLSWVEKPIEQKKCPKCAGSGRREHGILGRPSDAFERENCDECYGRRTVDVEQREPRPNVPDASGLMMSMLPYMKYGAKSTAPGNFPLKLENNY